VAQAAEHLFYKCDALSSNASPTKEQRTERSGDSSEAGIKARVKTERLPLTDGATRHAGQDAECSCVVDRATLGPQMSLMITAYKGRRFNCPDIYLGLDPSQPQVLPTS
jgi:hypothetical protein